MGKLGRYDLASFVHRLLVDCMIGASAAHWRRRAEQFGEVGNARGDEIQAACLVKARFIEEFADEPWEGYTDDLDAVLAEVRG